MSPHLARLREAEAWIGWVRLLAVPFGFLEVGLLTPSYPAGYEPWAWVVTGVLAAGAVGFFVLGRLPLRARALVPLGIVALAFDTGIVYAYVFVFSFEVGDPIRQLLFLPVVEAALRFGIAGGVLQPVVLVPILALAEKWRGDRFAPRGFSADHVVFPFGVEILIGLIVGWLVARLRREAHVSEERAAEAESLRDELGRRVDLLEAANRCARALGSSLELDQAFTAFIRELRGLIPFDRMAIVLAEDGSAQVIATAGEAAESLFPPGTAARPARGSVLDQVLQGQTVYRRDMGDARFPEEEEQFLELDLRCRVAAPLQLGARAIGMLAVVRREVASFTAEEIELLGLLARLVATAVQNIRSYEAERQTVEELRRLSALRSDFVSLVSHELRSPMAAVIGSARTLQQRWRELSPAQRESFLSLIADETSRLANLVGDVLDTSRIEAGSFSYAFSDVDVGQLVWESVAAAEVAQDEVRVRAAVREPLPVVRGDRERLRQVLVNLIDNAVKYSDAGEAVDVSAYGDGVRLQIEVRDRGPGIAYEHQKVIFEKFGRAKAGVAQKPGTGLGLFIARSIAEAHGGSLAVSSAPDQGATFSLALPLDGASTACS